MFLQSGNNNCNKDLIPYQNQKYYKVKNNADSDYYVDQLRVFISFWKRHLGYIHKYTHTTPAQIVFARTDFLGRPLKYIAPGVHAHSHMNGRVPGHARTASTTSRKQQQFSYKFLPRVDEGKSKTQTLCNFRQLHTSLSCQMNPAGLAYTQCV